MPEVPAYANFLHPLSFQFFYMITEKYMLGTLKEMQRWAYEIHSSFLVPSAPLRIPKIQQPMVEEIDR